MVEKKYDFQKLTPTQDANIEVYDEAISFVFENDDVKNVAISGAYGSGKSSLIETYKTRHPKKRFIHLSLASFRDSEQEERERIVNSEDNGEVGNVKESVLEGKILNQLIHQIPACKIPQTNFRIKKSVDKKATNKLSVFASMTVVSLLFVMFYNDMITHIDALSISWVKCLAEFFINQYSAIIITVFLVVSSVIVTAELVKIQKNKNLFHKISLQGNEIEIFENQDESYFDKYLNEVLYLFESADADVIVFEDMDRFNVTKIFERLREVNTLINIQRQKQQEENYVPVRFFYLIRDDIFISKDRTKFFDYIVPVVPIVDSSNSYEQFIKHLKAGNVLDNFDRSFLKGLSLYIDDMRILKNIYNEFIIYFNRLNTTDLNSDKMLAMIAYKNIFPRDFSNLQLKRGFVFEIFSKKDDFIKSEISALESEEKCQLELIELAKNDLINDETELDDVYEAKKKRLPGGQYDIVNFNLNIDSQHRASELDQECEKRKQALHHKLDDKLNELQAEAIYINGKINKTKTEMLKNIITRENIDDIFSVKFKNKIGDIDEFKEIRGSEYFDLLKYLIRNGYIDETYSDYVTYFYEDSISANDKIFLRRITDKRGADYTYQIKEPMKVISSPLLRQVDFEEQEALNFDLVQCLLDNSADGKYDNYLKILISQLKKNEKFDFVEQYYSKDISQEIFVTKVNKYWNDFFCTILKNNEFSKEQVRKYSVETLYYSDDEIIKSIDIGECLRDYISDSDDYLQIKEPNIPKLINRFKLLNVLFVTFNYDLSNKDLFKEVYKENLYLINFSNLKLMLQKEYLIDNENDIYHKNYTLIQSDANSPLAKYIANNLSEYIEVILESCGGKVCDELNDVTYLLNCDDLEYQQKENYISVLSTMLNDISSISNTSLWQHLLIKGLIVFDEDNVLKYYSQFGLGIELIDYINASVKPLDFTNIKNTFGEEASKKFFGSIFVNNGVDTDKYKKILLDLGYHYNVFTSKDIVDAKINVIINEKIIRMTVENLLHLREYYPKHINKFIETNLDEYLELQTSEIFDLNEALKVIEMDFEIDKKIEFITFTSEPISIVDKGYEDELCVHILSHNLCSDDLNNLYQRYSMYSKTTKEKIFELAIANISNILNSQVDIDDLLLLLLFESDRFDFTNKINLFDYILPKLNEEQCKTIFDEIGAHELKEIFTQWSGRKKYSITSKNTEVLEVLKNHSWIYEYKIDEKNPEKYIIIKNKPKFIKKSFEEN